jgi:hypothetical protein
MHLAHLPAVLAIEQAVYPFPWSHGNFVDSLAAGHGAQVLRAAERHGIELRGLQPGRVQQLEHQRQQALRCARAAGLLRANVALANHHRHGHLLGRGVDGQQAWRRGNHSTSVLRTAVNSPFGRPGRLMQSVYARGHADISGDASLESHPGCGRTGLGPLVCRRRSTVGAATPRPPAART